MDLLGIPVRFHHGYAEHGRWREVYTKDGSPLLGGEGWSVHPPSSLPGPLEEWLEKMVGIPIETMYPGQPLGTEEDLLCAMQQNALLAVDISHLYIQLKSGVLSKEILNRLYN